MADNDSQVDLKKRARRRLVGSAALALAAAIVLPMVMDHEPRTPLQDVQIRIPGQEGSNFTSRVITGKGPTPSQPVAGAVAEETAPPVVDDSVRRKSELDADSPVFKPGEELIPPSRKADQPKADARAEAPPKPDPKLEAAKLKEKEREKERDREREREKDKEREKEKAQAEAARAKALLAGAAPKASGPDSPHVVSLGAYREAANVSGLRAKLKAEGYSSYVEPLGDKVRVRAGPFPNKAAADKAAARISKILGVSASVAAKP